MLGTFVRRHIMSSDIMVTAKWIWDRSIFSIIEPSFDIVLFQDFWRFAQICTDMIWFLLLFGTKNCSETITKTILWSCLCKSVQIFRNTGTLAHCLTWFFGYFLGYLLGSIQRFLPAAAWETLVSPNHTNENILKYRC